MQSLKTRAKQLEEARERKQADLEQQRSARENEELAECSFAPPKGRKPPLAPKVDIWPILRHISQLWGII